MNHIVYELYVHTWFINWYSLMLTNFINSANFQDVVLVCDRYTSLLISRALHRFRKWFWMLSRSKCSWSIISGSAQIIHIPKYPFNIFHSNWLYFHLIFPLVNISFATFQSFDFIELENKPFSLYYSYRDYS